jgi:SAM-dependent methyltransferase
MLMRDALKSAIKAALPATALHWFKTARAHVEQRAARRAFQAAGPGGEFLSPDALPRMQARYPLAIRYAFNEAAFLERGKERAKEVGQFFSVRGKRILELAAHDGMVCAVLAEAGARATASALDLRHIDPRVARSGADAAIADAGDLPFAAGTYDLVFSYNAFEHFADPEAVLAEALRVTKPGGIVYFNFGPLYASSFGLHAMHAITVPFCQFLWPQQVLDEYVISHGLRRIEYESLNRWTVRQFRDLWNRWQPSGQTVIYRETPSVHGIGIIEEHPACFRGKVAGFENLIVAVVEIAMRRTVAPIPSRSLPAMHPA